MSTPIVSSTTPNGKLVGSDGTGTYAFIKWMQGVGTTVNVAFDTTGIFQGAIGSKATIDGRSTLATIVQNIDTGGVVEARGIDFARAYLNKDTDHITDGVGSPLAGGRVAEAAFVTSAPIVGQTLRFDGTHWLPVAIAVSKASTLHQWLKSYDAATGLFTEAQPAYSDLTGQIQFETNTVNNASQTKLNLIQGSNVTITDGGSGNITIAASTTAASGYVVRFKSANYTAVANDAVFCNTTSSGIIVTLPAAASNTGATIIVKKISADGTANRVTIAPTGGDLVDGATSQQASLPLQAYIFVSDGVSNWWIV